MTTCLAHEQSAGVWVRFCYCAPWVGRSRPDSRAAAFLRRPESPRVGSGDLCTRLGTDVLAGGDAGPAHSQLPERWRNL